MTQHLYAILSDAENAEILAEMYYDASWRARLGGTDTRWQQLQPQHRAIKVEAMRRFLDVLPFTQADWEDR